DQGRAAHRREAMQGSGDSGGPVLMRDGGRWTLVGLASWRSWQGDLANFRAGIYGQSGYQTRVSFYADWIDSVIAARR
ncbi:MAG TPA: trypsin-like serine protease, partial [Verrucomicrobiae bacterium]|nr:trypsin-like serine protease [Verrucomicrobiae bacterium]